MYIYIYIYTREFSEDKVLNVVNVELSEDHRRHRRMRNSVPPGLSKCSFNICICICMVFWINPTYQYFVVF